MAKLSYEMLLAPFPITLSYCTLRKPTLKEIYDISFTKYYLYQLLATLTPESYFKEFRNDQKLKDYWNSLSDDEQKSITLFSLISADPSLWELYLDMLNFFMIETVDFQNGYYFVIHDEADDNIISEDDFNLLLSYIRQICNLPDEETKEEEPVFKNDIAKRMYEKMQKAEKVKSIKKNFNLSLPNIISKVSNNHPTISPITVWDLTVFQLLDAFGCVQQNIAFEIQSTRVSVWGDEKNKFDIGFWYENTYDKKE